MPSKNKIWTALAINRLGQTKKYHMPRAKPHYATPTWSAHKSRHPVQGI
jgi:hypothetical protein